MKRFFKSYCVIWAIMLVLFNIVAFVVPGWGEQPKYTGSFWTGYIFTTLALVGQLVCAWYMFKKGNNAKTVFYNLPLLTVSRTGLILTFVIGSLCMLVSPLPYWTGIVLCAIVLAFTAIAVIKADLAADLISDVDNKIKDDTFFIKSLTVDSQSLLAKTEVEETKTICQKVYEAVRYSDPVSVPALASIESEITLRFSNLSDAVSANDMKKIETIAKEVLLLLDDRNNKCKLLK